MRGTCVVYLLLRLLAALLLVASVQNLLDSYLGDGAAQPGTSLACHSCTMGRKRLCPQRRRAGLRVGLAANRSRLCSCIAEMAIHNERGLSFQAPLCPLSKRTDDSGELLAKQAAKDRSKLLSVRSRESISPSRRCAWHLPQAPSVRRPCCKRWPPRSWARLPPTARPR